MFWGLMKSKGVKIGGSLLGGSGLIALIMGLHFDVSGKIDKAESNAKQYAELVVAPIKTEITNLKTEVSDTKEMVRDIHNYLLNKNK